MRFTSTAHWIDGWWQVQCDQCPRAFSQVRDLAEAQRVHPGAIAFVADLPVDQVELVIRPETAFSG